MFQYHWGKCFNTRGKNVSIPGGEWEARAIRGSCEDTVGSRWGLLIKRRWWINIFVESFKIIWPALPVFLAKNAIIVTVYLGVNDMGLKFSCDSQSQTKCHKFRMLMWLLVIVKTEEHLALSSDCDLWRRTPGLTRRLLKQNCRHDLQNHKICAIVRGLSAIFLNIGCDKNNDHPHLVWLIPDIVL